MARFGFRPPGAATLRRYLPLDAVAVAAFVLAGERSHRVPLAELVYVAETAVPFYLGWAVGALAAGAYADGVDDSLGRFVGRTFVGWVLGAAVAMGLRATPLFHGDAAVTLFLVTSGVGGALVLGGRVGRRALARR